MHKLAVNRLAFCFIALTAVAGWYVQFASAADSGVIFGVRIENGQLVIRSLDLGGSLAVKEHGKFPQPTEQRLAAVFQDKDRSIGVLYASTNTKVTRRVRIQSVGPPERVMDVSASDATGLAPFEALSSVLIPSSGPSTGLVSHFSDTPPFSLVTVNLQPAQVIILKRVQLDPEVRYAHLTKCPDGAVYATALAPQYDTHLVQLDVDKQTVARLVALKHNGENLSKDVRDLACGPSGQLYALHDPDYSGTNSLFRITLATGEMTAIQKFAVDRMAFVY
jgi:hypothetical protein